MKVLLFIGSLVSIWLVASPLICLYWLFKPAERFWWKHKSISGAIFFGSFFGCVGVITAGIYFFLWFFPSGWTGFQARLYLSVAIGFIASFALWCKLPDCLEQKRQKDREGRIDWAYQKQKRSLLKGETTLAPFIEEIKKLEKEGKLSPFLEEKLIALERVCDDLNVRWRQEGAPREANIHKNYDDPTDPTPNAYGYDAIDGPIEEGKLIPEEIFNDCLKSEQKGHAELSPTQREFIKAFLKSLTRTEKLIIVLYYHEEMTMPDIANVLDLSLSEVSQMRSSIITRLKAQMKKRKSIFEPAESLYQTENSRSNATMFERFTDRAHKVVVVAKQEARRLNHEYIGTEHLLLALVQEAGVVCRKIFNDFNITEANVQQETEKFVKSGPDLPIDDEDKLPQTPRAKNIIKYAIEEARNLQQNYYVDTEHILLGLLRETDGIAYEVLTNLGLQLDEVRKKVLELLGSSPEGENHTQ